MGRLADLVLSAASSRAHRVTRDRSAARRDDSETRIARCLHDAIALVGGRRLGRGYQASVELYSTPPATSSSKKPHRSALLGGFGVGCCAASTPSMSSSPACPACRARYGLIDRSISRSSTCRARRCASTSRARGSPGASSRICSRRCARCTRPGRARDLKRKDNIIVGAGERPFSSTSASRRAQALAGSAAPGSSTRVRPTKRVDQAQARAADRLCRSRRELSPEDARSIQPVADGARRARRSACLGRRSRYAGLASAGARGAKAATNDGSGRLGARARVAGQHVGGEPRDLHRAR